jgi:hypothetical protein
LIETLDQIRTHVLTHGQLSDEHRRWLTKHLEWSDDPTAYKGISPDGLKAELREALDRERDALRERLKLVADGERRELEVQHALLAVPLAADLDRIIRYESSLLRGFYRASYQLERVQRQRKGDFVPPPIQIGLGQGG